jgi:hypothetical protein
MASGSHRGRISHRMAPSVRVGANQLGRIADGRGLAPGPGGLGQPGRYGPDGLAALKIERQSPQEAARSSAYAFPGRELGLVPW